MQCPKDGEEVWPNVVKNMAGVVKSVHKCIRKCSKGGQRYLMKNVAKCGVKGQRCSHIHLMVYTMQGLVV